MLVEAFLAGLDFVETLIPVFAAYLALVVMPLAVQLGFDFYRGAMLRQEERVDPYVELPPEVTRILPPPLSLEYFESRTPIVWPPGRQRIFKQRLASRANEVWLALANSWISFFVAASILWLALRYELHSPMDGWTTRGDPVNALLFLQLVQVGYSLIFRFGVAWSLTNGRDWWTRFMVRATPVFVIVMTCDLLLESLDRDRLGWVSALTLSFSPLACYLVLSLALRLRPVAIPRRDLVLLRIFNSGKSQFLISGLQPIWDNFGSVLTCASTDLYSFDDLLQDRPTRARILRRIFIPGITAGLAACFFFKAGWAGWWPLLLAASLHGLLVAIRIYPAVKALIDSTLVRSLDDVERQFESLRTEQGLRERHGAFVHRHFSCNSQTWMTVVERLIAESSVILMDFRGLAPKNVGIRLELQRVFDRVPARRVLILLGSKSEQSDFQRMARDAWSRLALDSPNRDFLDRLKVYSTSKVSDRDLRRMAGLLFRDLL